VGMWLLFSATYAGREPAIMYLPLPVGLLVIFVWFRTALQEGVRKTVREGS
jgi:hypothetical protein